MPKITLDDIDFNTEDLSERGLATLKSLQFLEIQLQKLNNEVAVYQTAKQVYVSLLKKEIADTSIKPAKSENNIIGENEDPLSF